MHKFDVTQATAPCNAALTLPSNLVFVDYGQLGIVGVQDGWARKLIKGCTHMPNSCSIQTSKRSAIKGSDKT